MDIGHVTIEFDGLLIILDGLFGLICLVIYITKTD